MDPSFCLSLSLSLHMTFLKNVPRDDVAIIMEQKKYNFWAIYAVVDVYPSRLKDNHSTLNHYRYKTTTMTFFSINNLLKLGNLPSQNYKFTTTPKNHHLLGEYTPLKNISMSKSVGSNVKAFAHYYFDTIKGLLMKL